MYVLQPAQITIPVAHGGCLPEEHCRLESRQQSQRFSPWILRDTPNVLQLRPVLQGYLPSESSDLSIYTVDVAYPGQNRPLPSGTSWVKRYTDDMHCGMCWWCHVFSSMIPANLSTILLYSIALVMVGH
ncbi:hypothetical protein J6590_020082 [Homalodisca vitripennis]|nr:hypothetical protein J6590_020082 [Homalodisca vitripennis]